MGEEVADGKGVVKVALSDEVVGGNDGGAALVPMRRLRQLVKRVPRSVEEIAAHDVRRRPVN